MGADSDEELRARLRAVDPAAAIGSATSEQVARWAEDAMTGSTAPSRGRRWIALVAAAAVVVIGALGVAWGTGALRHGSAPVAVPRETVTSLDVPAASAGKCMVVSTDILRGQDFAFAGTVTDVADGQATLRVTRWYRGEHTDKVVVKAPNADLQMLLSAVDFQEGKDYLVSGTGRTVSVCGFSALYSAELAALYAEAYGG